jgi:hypothetical protein
VVARDCIGAVCGTGIYARGGLFKDVMNAFILGRSIKKYKSRVE